MLVILHRFLLQKQSLKQRNLIIQQKINNALITVEQMQLNQNLLQCANISTNCNPMPNSIEFLSETLIVFCSKNQACLYDITLNKILINMNCKKLNPNRANCIKTIPELQSVVVGYDSGHIIVYQLIKDNQRYDFKIIQAIKQNSNIVSLHLDNHILTANNNEAEIIQYFINFQQFEKVKKQDSKQLPQNKGVLNQIYKLKFPLNKIISSISSFTFKNNLITFLGGVDQKIHVYSQKIVLRKPQQFKYCFSLAGHQNGITKLTATKLENGKFDQFLLASASKDGYIRIWKITTNQAITKFHKNVKTLSLENENQTINLKTFLDSVLISHQCSVTSLHWVKYRNNLQLASCSLDCTICIWSQQEQINQIEAQEEKGSWLVKNRMGQLLGNKNAYFEVLSDPSSKYLVSVNFIGSALIWQYSRQTDRFTLRESFTGHSNHVKGIDWNHTSSFLVSVSKDQTTRVLAKNRGTDQYAQISRAQIHGYDINTVSVIKVKDNTVDVIACGADEKVIRIVQPPACFANYLNSFTLQNLHLYFGSQQEENKYIRKKADEMNTKPLLYETYSEGGVQVLGLMTKMQRVQRQKINTYYEDGQDIEQNIQGDNQKQDKVKAANQINFNIPPHDDYLVKHTLWPEMNKLYGHPHELQFLAKNNDSTFLASSCHALNKESATIIIWDVVRNWKITKMIQHHSYTVFGMQFSQDGKYFASVSKDRKLAVFDSSEGKFDLAFSYQAHSRAVTCLSIHQNSSLIATGSRDKSIKIHSISQQKIVQEMIIPGCNGVFAIAFGKGKYADLLAVGDQNGNVYLVKINPLKILSKVSERYSHTEVVNQIKWKGEQGQFATCSDDHSVKIFKVVQ